MPTPVRLPLRLVLAPSLVMLALVALLYAAAAWPLSKDLRRDAAARVERGAQQLAQRVTLTVGRRLSEVQLLARGLATVPLDDVALLRERLDWMKAHAPAYAWVALTDPQGKVLAASGGWLQGSSVAQRPVYLRGREAPWFGEFHVAKLLKPFLASSEQGEVYVADAAAPVLGRDGELRAVLVAHLHLDWMTRMADDLFVSDEAQQGLGWTLVQADGQALATRPLPFAPAGRSDDKAQLLQAENGRDYLVARRDVRLGPEGELRWQAVVGQDLLLATAPLHRLYAVLAGFALLTLLLGGGLAWWATRRVARPYEALLTAAHQRFEAAGSGLPQAEFLRRLGDELVAALPLHKPEAEVLLRRLASNAEQLQRTLDHLPMGVLLCDAAQQVVFANRTFCELLGRSAGELQGRPALDLLLPEPRDAAKRQALEVIGDPPAPRSAALELMVDGNSRSVAWQRVPLLNREQRLDSVLMLVQDQSAEVGERRRADALQRRFAMLVDNALSDAFVTLGADGRVLDWSQGAVHLTGWAAMRVAGRPLAGLLAQPEQAAELFALAQRDGQALLDARMLRADGSAFIAQGRLYKLADGDGDFALIFSDATKAQEAAQRVQQSEARLAAVISGASDAIISTDAEGRVLLFNPAAERIFGLPQAQMLGQTLERLLPPAERGQHPARMAAFAASEATRRPMGVGKVTGVRSDGEPLTLEAAISAARVADRTVLTAILRDVSERERAEQRLVGYQLQLTELTQRLLAQEKETTRKLAQSLHDELGQTLAAMRLMVDAGLHGAGSEALPRWVQRLDAVVSTANRRVREVLMELRPPLLDDEGLRAALANELQQQQERHEGLRLELDWQADAAQRWPADVEYAAFMVAREALGNALRHAQASCIRLQASGDERRLALQVIDDGVGDTELASRLRPGHLGLVGMRERALAIGARLDYESSPAQGTTVHLTWGGKDDEPALPD
jgi:PAS domain S-box-containing protein